MESGPEKVIDRAFDPEAFRKQGHRIVDQLADALARARKGNIPVRSAQTPGESFAYWREYLTEEHHPEDLLEKVLEHSFRCHHPNNLGHQVGPVLPAAALADLAGSLLDTGNGVFEVGNPATPMERVVLKDLADRIGYPNHADGILTSGGSLGNLTALLAMRQHQTGSWDTGTNQRFTILVSEESHYCIERSAKIMGWGGSGLTRVKVDPEFRLSPKFLGEAYTQAAGEGFTVLGVVACAGSTATGRIDPLREIATFCEEHDLWFHVDAAHAGAFVFSQEAKQLLEGIELADSLVIDFHKMALSPSLVTAVLFRNGEDSFETFAQNADYLWKQDASHEWWDSAKRTLECTRPMLGLRAYAVLLSGAGGLLEAYIDQSLEMTHLFADIVRDSEDFDLLTTPESNIICYRYHPKDAGEEILNQLNSVIRQKIIDSGEFYIVQVEIQGSVYLRSALMNPFIDRSVIQSLLERIRTEGTELFKSSSLD